MIAEKVMGKIIKDTIYANGIDIGIYTQDFENECISLMDIAWYKSDDPTAKGNRRDVATRNQLLVLQFKNRFDCCGVH